MSTHKYIISEAIKLIKEGKLVAFPTETVYGLGANAYNQEACLAIYKAKGRPSNNPLIVHVANINQAFEIAEFNENAKTLSNFWPGPLTLVLPLKKNNKLANCVTSGLETVAIRIPAHPIALELIERSQVPIAAPSANKSGFLSPTSYEHVKQNFGNDIFILDDKKQHTQYGLESTILDLSTDIPTILRYGFITPENIEDILNQKIATTITSKSSAIKAPGMLYRHYSPKTNLRLNATDIGENEVGLNFGNSKLNTPNSLNLSEDGILAEAAINLFNLLHQLDEYCLKCNISTIAVAPIPNKNIGLAINDRLSRGAQK